jgi:Replication Fork Protection Component Swi3
MASLAARRRVSFDAPRQSRQDRLALNRNYYTSDEDEEEDEEERIAREEEEEEERQLSAANGEAAEAPASTKKRKQTDQEIAAEYSTTVKKSKPRITLQPTHLTGADGLIRIQSDLASLQYPKKRSSQASAAAYSRSLIKAYKEWAYNLLPSLAFEDVLSRIETFGSKREIKNHITHMRTDVRNAHLERLFGKERSENMLRELEDGLKQQLQHAEDEIQLDASVLDFLSTQNAPTTGVLERAVPTSRASVMTKEYSPAPTECAPSPTKPYRPALAVLDDSDEELEFELKPSSTAPPPSTFCDTDDESDEQINIDSIEEPTNVTCTNAVPKAVDSVLFNLCQSNGAKAIETGSNQVSVGDVDLEDSMQAIVPALFVQNSDQEGACDDNERVLAVEMSFSAAHDTDLEPTQITVLATQMETQTTQMTVLASQTQNQSDDDEACRSQLTATQATVLASQIGETQNDESPSYKNTTTQDTP